MEIEAEHYTNGVVEGSSARIMNGTYKHEEILQPDDNSIGNGVAGTNPCTVPLWLKAIPLSQLPLSLSVCCQTTTVALTAGSYAEGTRQPPRG